MKTAEIEKDWMTKDMKRVIEQLTLGDYERSETDLLRLQRIQKDGRKKDFGAFYEIAGKMRIDINRQKREAKKRALENNLSEIQKQQATSRREIKSSNLGPEGLGKSRADIEQEFQNRLEQRTEEHRKTLTRLEDQHTQQMKILWADAEQELKLLEEQITLYSLRLETESSIVGDPAPSSQIKTPPPEPSSSPNHLEQKDPDHGRS